MSHSIKLDSAFVKLRWAKTCILNLQDLIRAFEAEQRKRAILEPDPDTGEMSLEIGVPRPGVDADCLLVVAIHSMRSALDCAASQLHFDATGKWGARVHFPFHETLAELRASFEERQIVTKCCGQARTTSGGNHLLAKHLPRFQEMVLKDFKPCRDGNSNLWMLNKADNIGKHRRLTIVTGNFIWEGGDFVSDQLVWEGNIVIGKLGRTIDFGHAGKPTIKNQPTLRFNIIFGEETPLSGRPVIPTLKSLFDTVEGIVLDLEAEFGNAKWVASFRQRPAPT